MSLPNFRDMSWYTVERDVKVAKAAATTKSTRIDEHHLPVDFPYAELLGSPLLPQWAIKDNARNWKKIPGIIEWMRNSRQREFQEQIPYKGNNAIIIQKLLNTILKLSSLRTVAGKTGDAENDLTDTMDLSNYGCLDKDYQYEVGRLCDNNSKLMTGITLSEQSKGTHYLTPFISRKVDETENGLCFPIVIEPNARNNKGGTGTDCVYLTIECPVAIFQEEPTPIEANHVLRINQFHGFGEVVESVISNPELGIVNRLAIHRGIYGMIMLAVDSGSLSSLEIRYNTIIKNWISSRLIPPTIDPAIIENEEEVQIAPGNWPLQGIAWDLTQINGQTPIFEWSQNSDKTGYTVVVTVHRAYYGHPLTGNPDNNDDLGWQTYASAKPIPIKIALDPTKVTSLQMPVVFATISDVIEFKIDEIPQTAAFKVADRAIWLHRTATEKKKEYPMYFRRFLAQLHSEKLQTQNTASTLSVAASASAQSIINPMQAPGQILTVGSKVAQDNANMASLAAQEAKNALPISLGALESLSGLSAPLAQALILAIAYGVAESCMPAFLNNNDYNLIPHATFYSTLFYNEDDVTQVVYRSSMTDIMDHWCNVQSSTLDCIIHGRAITFTDNGGILIVNPTGLNPLPMDGSVNDIREITSNTMFQSDSLFPNITSNFDYFGSGVTISFGVRQDATENIRLTSFAATAAPCKMDDDVPGSTSNPLQQNSQAFDVDAKIATAPGSGLYHMG